MSGTGCIDCGMAAQYLSIYIYMHSMVLHQRHQRCWSKKCHRGGVAMVDGPSPSSSSSPRPFSSRLAVPVARGVGWLVGSGVMLVAWNLESSQKSTHQYRY
jgi:hypothetical protein